MPAYLGFRSKKGALSADNPFSAGGCHADIAIAVFEAVWGLALHYAAV